MPSRHCRVLAVALAASLPACIFGSHPDSLRKLSVLHAPHTFTNTVRLEVIVMGPDGEKHNANGLVSIGGTTRGLCESLRSSLAYSGCEAIKEDAVTAADPLVRSMQQNVLLPQGWHFVSAETAAVGGKPYSELVVTIEPVK